MRLSVFSIAAISTCIIPVQVRSRFQCMSMYCDKILVSACLAGQYCRWDGGTNLVPEIQALVESGKAVPVCPEMLGGLPVPRLPSECLGASVFSSSGGDVTAQFRKGAEEALRICLAHGCTLAVLKAKSPSCGKGVIHNGLFDGGLTVGNGTTAQLLLEHGIEVVTEHEWINRNGSPSLQVQEDTSIPSS